MAKYHIGEGGIPKLCKAKRGRCPYASTDHFDTFAEAAKVSQNRLEQEYGLFQEPTEVSTMKTLDEAETFTESNFDDRDGENPYHYIHDTMTGKIHGKGNTGLDYEIYGSVSYAKSLGLNNTVIIDHNGNLVSDDNDDPKTKQQAQEVMERATNLIEKRVTEDGAVIRDREKLVRVVHYSDDGKTMFAQMGASNVLDYAKVEGDSVEIIEFKNFKSSGSQAASKRMNANADGSFEAVDGLPDNVQSQLAKLNMKDSIGTNPNLNLTNKEALEYLIDSYKSKGADKLAFLGTNDKVNEIDLRDSTEAIANRMEQENIKGIVRVRTNSRTKKPTDADIERWKTKRAKEYFVSGEFPEGSFKIKDVKPEVLEKYNDDSVGTRARIGEIYIPYTRKELKKLDPETEIQVSDLKASAIELIGEIRQRKN